MKKPDRRGADDVAAMLAAILTTAAAVCLAPSAMAAQVNATGGDYTNTTGGYRTHMFTNVGTSTFNVTVGGDVEVLVVAGGGGAGSSIGGGGGAGGLIYSNVYAISAIPITVTVGVGGAGGAVNAGTPSRGTNGNDSVFATLRAYGGGGGGANYVSGQGPTGGGSGGGGSPNPSPTGASGTNGQGYAGGNGLNASGYYGCGGGGGAGSRGSNGTSAAQGNGGAGTNLSQFASVGGSPAGWFAGGGAGGSYQTGATQGLGGQGGGGNGGVTTGNNPGDNGVANTGGGGGSGNYTSGYLPGGKGGSGIVIVRYAYNPAALAIQNGTAPSGCNLGSTQAVVTVSVINDGGSTATGYLFYGTNNAGLNLTWSFTNSLGTLTTGTTVTNTISGLSSNTTYSFMAYATNTAGQNAWGGGGVQFKTMGVPGVDNGGGATGIGPYSATLRGTLINGVSVNAIIYCGTDTNNWTYTNALGAVTEAQGIFATNQTGLARNTTYYYSVLVSNQYGTAQSPATNFTTLPYVWITTSTNLVESQSNIWNGVPVVVDGAGVVLTLSNSATYGNLPVYQFGSLIVTNGASVVSLGQNAFTTNDVNAKGVAIQSAGDVAIAGNGSSINADGTGFPANTGPGGTYANLMGGTYGGRGDANTNATYGSYKTPTSLGSGGRSANGGGAIKLIVAGNLVVNGRLSANGNWFNSVYLGGAGAGGSIWIAGGTLCGTGEVQVAGGLGEYSACGGGGGRFAMDDSATYNFHGNIRGALGSQNSQYGSVGTIYFSPIATPNFTVFSNQTIVVGDDTENVFGNLTVYGTLIPGGTTVGLGTGAVIRAANITVSTSGAISADGWGFAAGWGPAPATGAWNGTNGASHGGIGLYPLGAPYGLATQPTSMGSGGQNLGGGGAVKLVVTGTLTVNGTVSANALGGNDRPGSAGGSVWIDCGSLVGNGSIRADGAVSTYGGGGGGGRIAIKYRTKGFVGLPATGLYTNQQSISSTVTVKGGYNTSADGPEDGSIYIQTVSQGTAVYFH